MPADRVQIEQVLVNLILNGCDTLASSPPEERKITVGTRRGPEGSVDFLTKPVEREPLLGAIRSALDRNALDLAERSAVRTIRSRFGCLSEREKEVFRLVVEGRLNKQIAGSLGTSERTVKAHRARAMEKMGANSLADLVRKAERLRGR